LRSWVEHLQRPQRERTTCTAISRSRAKQLAKFCFCKNNKRMIIIRKQSNQKQSNQEPYAEQFLDRAGVREEDLILVSRAHGHRGRDLEKGSFCHRWWCTQDSSQLVCRHPCPGCRYFHFFLHREREPEFRIVSVSLSFVSVSLSFAARA
jgi:hypothetical protein